MEPGEEDGGAGSPNPQPRKKSKRDKANAEKHRRALAEQARRDKKRAAKAGPPGTPGGASTPGAVSVGVSVAAMHCPNTVLVLRAHPKRQVPGRLHKAQARRGTAAKQRVGLRGVCAQHGGVPCGRSGHRATAAPLPAAGYASLAAPNSPCAALGPRRVNSGLARSLSQAEVLLGLGRVATHSSTTRVPSNRVRLAS